MSKVKVASINPYHCNDIRLRRFSGISSNRWICPLILIGIGNLYPVLLDSVVETCIDPNKFYEVTSEHNLEESII